MIDVDAVPLDLPARKQRPIGMAYLATAWPLPDGSVAIVPHYGGGSSLPMGRARAAGTVAKIGRVCLRARKGGGRTGGCPTAARTTRDRPAWRPRFYPANAAKSSEGGRCED